MTNTFRTGHWFSLPLARGSQSLISENTREVASLDPLNFLTLSDDTENFGLPQH